MHKSFFIILLVFFCSQYTKAQSLADIKSPRITPPAPEAAALGKYGQIPVDKNSGIPQIAIPLYEIKTPRFSIPISLSYHASGIKVDEMATWVGTGWSLNAGGVITRSIVNLPDEDNYLSYPSKTASQIRNTNDTTYLKEATNHPPAYDTQPDNFFYNFLDKSGAFVFGSDKVPVLTPYKPIKITFNLTSTPKTFTIVDESGNAYLFNDIESTASGISTSLSGASSWYLSQMISADRSDTVKFIYQVDPVNYNQYSYSYTQNYGPYMDGTTCNTTSSLWPASVTRTRNVNTVVNPTYIKQILFRGGKVDFVAKSGRLDGAHFSLDSVIVSNYDYQQKKYGRIKGFKLYTGYWFNDLNNPTSDGIVVINKYRLKLDSVAETDKNNVSIRSHKFEYNPVLLPPMNLCAQDYWGYYNGKNGNQTLLESKQYVAGSDVYTVAGSAGADRQPDSVYMKAGMLEKVIYPTHGYTVFDYEPHRYLDYSQTTSQQQTVLASSVGYYSETKSTYFTTGAATSGSTVPGILTVLLKHTSGFPGQLPETPYVAIFKVSTGANIYLKYANTTTDINSTEIIQLEPSTQYRLYALSKGGTSSMSTDQLPTASISIKYTVQVTSPPTVKIGGGIRIRTIKHYERSGALATTETYKYGSSMSGVGELMNGSLVFLNANRRIFYGFFNDQIHQAPAICTAEEIIYANNSIYSLSTLSGSPISYGAVTQFNGDSVMNVGKSVYVYGNYPDSLLIVDSYYQNGVKPIPVTWKNGQIIYEAHYLNKGNNQYAVLQEKFNDYYDFARTGGQGLFIGPRYETVNFNPYNWPFHPIDNFIFFDYPISSGSRVPKQTIMINYDTDGIKKLVQDTVNYYYDNLNHVFPTRITQKSSRSETLQKQISYPQDMVNAGKDPTGIYAAMTTANMISPAIEFAESKNGTQLMKSRTNYAVTNNLIEPQTVELQTMANPSEIRLNYQKYDTKGNILTVSKQGGPTQRYIWDYQKAFPVAQIINAGADSVAYTSFEADGTGNWTIASSQRDITAAFTGNKSYNLSNGNITKSGLTAANIYVVSYWTRNASPLTITGTITGYPIKGTTINGWTYYEHQLTGQTTLTVSGTGNIDELRLYPKEAQLTTYTYSPLIGVTSSTDAKNQTTYYEYDGLGRLQNIKDQNGNIVKNYDYHYGAQ
ncbi:hypothetical protein ACFJIV_23515 [Mucilaginibacter sp. UC70_90]